MIQQTLRKAGNSYVVTIPRADVERLGLKEGQLLAIEVTPLEVRPVLRPALRAAFEASWQRSEAAYVALDDELA